MQVLSSVDVRILRERRLRGLTCTSLVRRRRIMVVHKRAINILLVR